MSSDAVIRFEGVWKRYERFAASRLHHTLAFWLGGGKREQFWALEDVDFEVERGQIFGIVGANGSGKSTALKIMAGITAPDRGRTEVRGRVGCLIEVSAGFDLELTGRENVYLNGTLHGMRRREIDRAFDAIVDFSGVAAFIDTPVKKYSSGMMMRLGFSVAMHTAPDIMLIDEVIAVGDAEFREKCYASIRDFCGRGGTVVLVSHNLEVMERLCHHAVWLDDGKKVGAGPPKAIIDGYLAKYRRKAR
jgi:lipopolysaccharide transport system ATP-binding protein